MVTKTVHIYNQLFPIHITSMTSFYTSSTPLIALNSKGCLINKWTTRTVELYVMYVMLTVLRETSGYLSQQPRGICRVNWSTSWAVCTVRLFVRHRRCYSTLSYQTTLIYLHNRLTGRTIRVSISVQARYFSLLRKVETDSRNQQATYSVGSGGSSNGVKATAA